MPVGTRAVSPTVDKPKAHPAKNCQADGIEMNSTCSFPGPAEDVKESEAPVKNDKQVI